jgi:citrate synthase
MKLHREDYTSTKAQLERALSSSWKEGLKEVEGATMEGSNIYREAIDKGLEGVVACSTAISSIVETTLCYRGYAIQDLAENSTFEETIWLLWNGKLPNSRELESFRAELLAQSKLDPDYVELLKSLVKAFPKNGHPMDFLRSAVSALAFFDADVNDISEAATARKSIRLTAKMGPIVAAFHRLRNGQPVLAPLEGKSLAYNFLYQLFGKEPTDDRARVMDVALILHADHEINCSAFSARVTISSLSDLHSAIVAAIGTLKGPLHGGANEAVLVMLEEIGSLAKVPEFVERAIATKQKVMGIGHRVYKNGDPRAAILRKYSERLTRERGFEEFYKMSILLDELMLEKKGLMPNVDFYSATVYKSMDIPSPLFTPIFAASRIAGWCAHALEQYSKNRIYRPRGEYIGPTNLVWTPINSR